MYMGISIEFDKRPPPEEGKTYLTIDKGAEIELRTFRGDLTDDDGLKAEEALKTLDIKFSRWYE